jgi:hypothetical protein
MVLGLLVALATMTVLTAVAGARRGQTAFSRLWARTLPTTITVLPNQPRFDWARIRALPEVTALSTFALAGFLIDGYPLARTSGSRRATARPCGRSSARWCSRAALFDPSRADEVVVTPRFLAGYGKGVGDTLTLHLATPQQIDQGNDPSSGVPPRGPRVRVRIVGVIRSFWFSDSPGSSGALLPSPALLARYRANFMGRRGDTYINALVRLKGGVAAIPAFRADLARVTHRSDIDVWNNYVDFGGPAKRVSAFEAACLLAFGLAALTAAVFLIGQSVARYISTTVADLQLLRAPGLRPRQAVAAAAAGPFLAAVAGTTLGVAGAIVVSRWMPIGAKRCSSRSQVSTPTGGLIALAVQAWLGLKVLSRSWFNVDALWAATLVGVGAVALALARAGLPVPAVVGTRFALEPGRGRSAVPVRPALAGAIVGVLGVLAAFTFAAGVSTPRPTRPDSARQISCRASLALTGRPPPRQPGRRWQLWPATAMSSASTTRASRSPTPGTRP